MSCLVIAEMANAHGGSPTVANTIVQAAAAAGADAVKFQVFTAVELAVPDFKHFGLYEKLQFSESEWIALVRQAKGLGLQVYADVFGIKSASLMHRLEVDGLMIHAADILNTPLLRWAGSTRRAMILSVAGSTLPEVANALRVLKTAGAPSVLLMHGFQGYPTPIHDSGLNRIRLLKREFSCPVGFASHIDGAAAEARLLPTLAMAAGADALEVHLTDKRDPAGYDYFSSLEPGEFAEMIRTLRGLEAAMGPDSAEPSEREIIYRRDHRKSLIAMRTLEPGDEIAEDDVAYRRINNPPDAPQPGMDSVLGRTAPTRIPKYSPLTDDTLGSRKAES